MVFVASRPIAAEVTSAAAVATTMFVVVNADVAARRLRAMNVIIAGDAIVGGGAIALLFMIS